MYKCKNKQKNDNSFTLLVKNNFVWLLNNPGKNLSLAVKNTGIVTILFIDVFSNTNDRLYFIFQRNLIFLWMVSKTII